MPPEDFFTPLAMWRLLNCALCVLGLVLQIQRLWEHRDARPDHEKYFAIPTLLFTVMALSTTVEALIHHQEFGPRVPLTTVALLALAWAIIDKPRTLERH